MSSASKKDAVCEPEADRDVMVKEMTEIILLRIANSVPQLAVQ